MHSQKRDIAKLAWIVGGVLAAIGEIITAFDPTRGNTISEHFDRLPQPAKYFVILAVGCVIGHWCWPMPTSVPTSEESASL